MSTEVCPLSGKVIYASKAEAKRASRYVRRGRKQEPYYCRDGGHWYLTSKALSK